MPASVPENLRAALGEEGADALFRWLDDDLQEHPVRRDESREVPSRLDTMKERCHRIDGRIEHEASPAKQTRRPYDGRTDRIQDRLDQLEKQLNDHRHRVNMRLGRIRKEVQIQWFAGLAVFLGILVTVLTIAVFAT